MENVEFGLRQNGKNTLVRAPCIMTGSIAHPSPCKYRVYHIAFSTLIPYHRVNGNRMFVYAIQAKCADVSISSSGMVFNS